MAQKLNQVEAFLLWDNLFIPCLLSRLLCKAPFNRKYKYTIFCDTVHFQTHWGMIWEQTLSWKLYVTTVQREIYDWYHFVVFRFFHGPYPSQINTSEGLATDSVLRSNGISLNLLSNVEVTFSNWLKKMPFLTLFVLRKCYLCVCVKFTFAIQIWIPILSWT